MRLISVLSLLVVLGACGPAYAGPVSKRSLQPPASDLAQWIASQSQQSLTRMLANIHPDGTAPGCVVAAQSKDSPPYWFNWIRDAALTTDTLLNEYESTTDPARAQQMEQMLWNYIDFNTKLQSTPSQSVSDADPLGLGEPKWNVDGSAFTGAWGRPQNDGPALRASVAARFARLYLKRGGSLDAVRSKIYRAEMPATTLAKRDLEMVSHNWQNPSFDLWEEVKGEHFYTLMVQRRGLLDGAQLASTLNDTGAAAWYTQQAGAVAQRINTHWDPSTKPYIQETYNRVGGLDYKQENLDIGSLLAVLHAKNSFEDGASPLFGALDDRVLATALALKTRFQQVYSINQGQLASLAPGIGRYPEDQYMNGNPWFLGTLALAETYYVAYAQAAQQGSFPVTATSLAFVNSLPGVQVSSPSVYPASSAEFAAILKGLSWEADSFFARVRLHAGTSGELDEQFDRNSGFQLSAKELTWSHAAMLTAARARASALALIGNGFLAQGDDCGVLVLAHGQLDTQAISDWTRIRVVLVSSYCAAVDALTTVSAHVELDKTMILASEPTIELMRQCQVEQERYNCYAVQEDTLPQREQRSSSVLDVIDKAMLIRFGETKKLSPALSVTAVSSGYALGSCSWVLQCRSQRIAIAVDVSVTPGRFPAAFQAQWMKDADAMLLCGPSRFSGVDWPSMLDNFEAFVETQLSQGVSIVMPTSISNACYIDILHALFRILTSSPSALLKDFKIVATSPVIAQFLTYANVTVEYLAKPYQDRGFSAQLPLIPLDVDTIASRLISLRSPDDPRLVTVLLSGAPVVVLAGHQFSTGRGDFREVLHILAKLAVSGHAVKSCLGFPDATWSVSMREEVQTLAEGILGHELEVGYCFLDPRLSAADMGAFLRFTNPRELLLSTPDPDILDEVTAWREQHKDLPSVAVGEPIMLGPDSKQQQQPYVAGWLSPEMLENVCSQALYQQQLLGTGNTLTLASVAGVLNIHNGLNVAQPPTSVWELDTGRNSADALLVGQIQWDHFVTALEQMTGVKREVQSLSSSVHMLYAPEYNLTVTYNITDGSFSVTAEGDDHGFRRVVVQAAASTLYKL
ncbi:hypothetical protein RI367_006117 [Sorochytrium milnesiophthora]